MPLDNAGRLANCDSCSSIPHHLAPVPQIETDSAIQIAPTALQKGIPQRISQATRYTSSRPTAAKRSTWLVLLQNDNELRATGGFMGSYAF